MKKTLLIGVVVLLGMPLFCFGQNEKKPLHLSEFSISGNRMVNHAVMGNMDTEDGYGLGVGIRCFLGKSSVGGTFVGLVYDYTSLHKPSASQGRFGSLSDVSYNLHYLSIPLGYRFGLFNQGTIFLETSLFFDIKLSAQRRGTFHSSLPNQDTESREVNENCNQPEAIMGYLPVWEDALILAATDG